MVTSHEDAHKFDPAPGEKFLRIVEKNISGDFYRFICIYMPAQEKDSSRPGGYCGVSLILKNTNSPDPSITIKVLDELLNSLYSIGTNKGKFLFKVTQIFTKIPIPNDLKTLTDNLITSDSPAYQKITNNTLLLSVGEGMTFAKSAIQASVSMYKEAETQLKRYDKNIVIDENIKLKNTNLGMISHTMSINPKALA